MKKGNPEADKKIAAAAAFKIYDPKVQGRVTRQEFAKLHRDISRVKMIALSLDECIDHLDAGFTGIIHFNDFMQMVMNPAVVGTSAASRSEDSSSPQKREFFALRISVMLRYHVDISLSLSIYIYIYR